MMRLHNICYLLFISWGNRHWEIKSTLIRSRGLFTLFCISDAYDEPICTKNLLNSSTICLRSLIILSSTLNSTWHLEIPFFFYQKNVIVIKSGIMVLGLNCIVPYVTVSCPLIYTTHPQELSSHTFQGLIEVAILY